MIGLALRSLRHYYRMHLGVLCGVTLAGAVLTGALLVGDSVDYSLRLFASMRLGDIQHAIHTGGNTVDQALARRLEDTLGQPVAAAFTLRGMAIHQGDRADDRRQINNVDVIGIADDFWAVAGAPALDLADGEVALSEKLALALDVGEGDEVALRVEKPSLLPRDAGLSKRDEDRSIRRIFRVKTVLPDENMGRFSLAPTQIAPYNAFVQRDMLQDQLDLPGKANLLLTNDRRDVEDVQAALVDVWQPADSGLTFAVFDGGIVQLESEGIYIPDEVARAALGNHTARGTLTYLVNGLSSATASTPYSFMTAGPVPDAMGDGEMVINRWLADALSIGPGDAVTVAYYELTPANEFVEKTRDFTVHSVREMEDLELEHALMPIFPGLSDVDSCADWDVGMPMDDELLADKANEDYWNAYRQTPKGLVTLAAGQKMWGNRFGAYTAIRFDADGAAIPALEEGLRAAVDPELLGLAFQPVQAQAQEAVSKAMDFGGLFIGMSFFIIAAALLLTGLLFVFGLQHRTGEMGMLLAVGLAPGQVRRLFLAEGALLALAGALAGAALSTLYTRALLFGLAHYWQGALANAAICYHATGGTLATGVAITVLCALAAMVIALRGYLKRPARELLQMDFSQSLQASGGGRARGISLAAGLAGTAIAIAILAALFVLRAHNGALIGFGAGTLLLFSVLLLCRYALLAINDGAGGSQPTLARLALQNVARRRGRSLATITLLAGGAFLVFAVSAMQEDLQANAGARSAGTGGFALLAESTFPLLERPSLFAEDPALSAAAIKVRDGADASCLNLNHSQQPGVLGVHVPDFADRGAFGAPEAARELWGRLNLELEDGAIPALAGDANTAMWTLKKKAAIDGGGVLLYNDENGNEIKVQLVGALPMRLSVFQGKILLSDANFTRLFPGEDGYRMFLIDAPADRAAETASQLKRNFDRYGLDAIPPVERVLEFYAVETTYLAMFLVLGGLGLAIGSVGMGVVVLRNLLERRGELAMLGALGFRHPAIIRMLYVEYGFLLLAGLGTGIAAAAFAVIPALFNTSAQIDLGVQIQLALLVLIVSIGCTAAAILLGFRREAFDALRSE